MQTTLNKLITTQYSCDDSQSDSMVILFAETHTFEKTGCRSLLASCACISGLCRLQYRNARIQSDVTINIRNTRRNFDFN